MIKERAWAAAGSANVFADLGLREPEQELTKAQSSLAHA